MSKETIHTERLILRLPSLDDTTNMVQALNDWEVCRWLSRVPYPYQKVDAVEFIKVCRVDQLNGTAFRFVIEYENQLSGFIGLEKKTESCFELGYWITRAKWGKGIAGEAILSISKFAAEEVGATRIVASCNRANHRSENVLLRTGFTRKGLGQQYSISLDEHVITLEFFLDLDG